MGRLVPIGAAGVPARAAVVAEAPKAKAGKPEEIYRAWLELAEQRIAAEQVLASGYTLSDNAPDKSITAVLNFFDTLAPHLFTRQTDVGELSAYIAADARRWRDLLRALRQRSAQAARGATYQTLTRALAAAEFLASEPIGNAEREEFALTDLGAHLSEDSRTAEISANFVTRLAAPKATPNIAICLRDANGDVCGEAVFAAPLAEAHGERSELFTATLTANRDIADVEVSLTRRAAN